MGISFTPRSKHQVVGLWRHDALEESYAAAGFNMGTIYHHCMLYRYGAMQAEMPQDRALQTHAAFRSTYNLYYEVVRHNNNMPSFAKDSDAYNLTPRYYKECSSTIHILRKAKSRMYGVRDEYHVSGQAAQTLLREIMPQVRDLVFLSVIVLAEQYLQAKRYMESRPVLWIPSDVWFEFLARRMEEIQRTQIQLKRLNPANLGILTGILNHMLRSAITTPIVYDFHVRESLALIEYYNVVKKANMFFLQELELNLEPCLDSVQENNDFHVLALMGLNAKAQWDKALAARKSTVLDGFDQTAVFPIRPNPTWSQLKGAIRANPILMLKEWTMPAGLQNQLVTLAHLFCQFTMQIWLMVDHTAMKGIEPAPTSLSDAMKCWTVSSIDQTLLHTTFEAYGMTGLDGISHGHQGPHSMDFAGHKEIYFPVKRTPPQKGSQWLSFWDDAGYVTAYHKLLEEHSQEEGFYLNDGLEAIFSQLHCLPASQKGTQKSKGFVWRIKANTFVFHMNPLFYKVEGLGKESKKASKHQGKLVARRPLKSRKVFEEVLWRSSGFDGLASKKVETEQQTRRA